MSKPSNRDRILEAGLKVMVHKGYVGAGCATLSPSVSPSRSFTNHFRSKRISREVLDVYFEHTKRRSWRC
jgi:TetR/AcrR family transcriptional repressor of nem operon